MSERLVIVGDALLDRDVEGRSERLCPDAPVPVVDQSESRARPGGAGLAALLAARTGIAVTLVTALAPDDAGAELARLLLASGVDLVMLGLDGATPEKVRVLDRGRPVVRLDRGGGLPRAAGDAAPALAEALRSADGVLVSDYGNGVASLPWVRAALARRPSPTPLVWDPHPRGPAPIPGATLVTPNRAEAAARAGEGGPRAGGDGRPRATWDGPGGSPTSADGDSPATLATVLRPYWEAEAVVVTCGGEGAVLADAAGSLTVPVDPVDGDPCGAGDRFAVAAAWAFACGADAPVAATLAADAASAFVAEGGARAIGLDPVSPFASDVEGLPGGRPAGGEIGAAPISIAPALRRAAAIRRAGGTVVATGGCFDLLHSGHLRTLRAARALGDCLIVLLNGDRSVRGRKGPERPVVGELERAELLAALDCVDEVAIFDEETPAEALSLLRPDVWAKGGDYALEALPEREAIAAWGGRTVLLPFLTGKSTTRLIEKAGQR